MPAERLRESPSDSAWVAEQLGLKLPRSTLEEAMSCVGGGTRRAQKGTLLEACAARGACRGNATRGISCFLSNGLQRRGRGSNPWPVV